MSNGFIKKANGLGIIWKNTAFRCDCSGYHFPHRKTGGACNFSPRADYYRAISQGLSVPEAQELLSVVQLERMFPLQSDL